MEINHDKIERTKQILANFLIQGGISDVKAFGSGHINDTYRVYNTEAGKTDYLLQRINHNIFKDVPGLINNIAYVTTHIKNKLSEVPGADLDKQVLTLIPTKNGLFYYQDTDGNYWRLYLFLKDTKGYDVVKTEQQAAEGGKAFGAFQTMLADIEVAKLIEVIPNFHNIIFRLKNFGTALADDVKGRAKDVGVEVAFINARIETMLEIDRLGKSGKLPVRVTHNDTKFNNVLLNADDKAQCVIDLDTIMPGYTAFDFGDAVRTIINMAAEDEPDVEKIQLNIPLFKAFAEAFLAQTVNYMTVTEIRSLIQGVFLLPYMIGVRFLTDYLSGDVYFKTKYSEHNLVRARAQFQLVRRLEENHDQIYNIVLQCVNQTKELDSLKA